MYYSRFQKNDLYKLKNSFNHDVKKKEEKPQVKKEHNIKQFTFDNITNNKDEKEFLNCVVNQSKMILSIGQKASGKTFFLLGFLKCALKYEFFDCLYLVLPVFSHEQNDSYKFIKEYKGKTKIIIYNEWDSELIISRIKQNPFERKFCCVDDSTGHFSAFIQDNELIKFISTLRHFNISLWVVTHSIRRSLPSTMRALIDIIIIYNTASKMSLEIIFDEYLSLLFTKLKDWISFFKLNVMNSDKDFNAVMVNTRNKNDNKIKVDLNEYSIVKK